MLLMHTHRTKATTTTCYRTLTREQCDDGDGVVVILGGLVTLVRDATLQWLRGWVRGEGMRVLVR